MLSREARSVSEMACAAQVVREVKFVLVQLSSEYFFFFFFTLVTGPRRALSLKLSDARVYEPEIRTRLGRN